MTVLFAIFGVATIFIIAALAYLVTAFLVALCVGIVVALFALFVAWILNPRPRKDHYEIPHGDYPKVTNGG